MKHPLMPETVVVATVRYTVVTDEAAIDRRIVERGHTFSGLTDLTAQRIYVDPRQGWDSQADTLLHEVLHCVYWAAGNPQRKLREEEVVHRLTPLLLATLRDNPALVACLTTDLGASGQEEGG